MKMKFIVAVACLAMTFTACKKDKKATTPAPGPVVNCDLPSERTNLFDGKLTYEYDSENRLVKILKDGAVQTSVEYKDGGKTVVESRETSIYTYTLNDDSKLVKVEEATNTGATYTTYYTYTDGLVSRTVSENIYTQGGLPVYDTTLYTNYTANGNLIKQEYRNTNGVLTATLVSTHMLNKPNNLPNMRPYTNGDLFSFPYDKNLLATRQVSAQNVQYGITYNYEFDTKGRIARSFLKVEEGNNINRDTITYKYRCD